MFCCKAEPVGSHTNRLAPRETACLYALSLEPIVSNPADLSRLLAACGS